MSMSQPENILYASNDEDSEVKVADFGLADILPKNKLLHIPCGTPDYVGECMWYVGECMWYSRLCR